MNFARAFVTFSILLGMSIFIPPSVIAAQPHVCTAKAFHDFDFWVGNWRVTDAKGAFQGTNNITHEFDSCVVQEHWVDSAGGRGSSFNTYLPGSHHWQQTWVDSNGLTLQLQGGLVGANMILEGPRVSKKGVTLYDRITWTPLSDGRVRQHWQESSDHAHWTEVFDGYYKRQAP